MNSSLSRRALIQRGASAGAALLASRVLPAWAQASADQLAVFPDMATFRNPLFAGDFADPSIVRVGADFYATFTSYQYAPGLQVWHSRDLVNWEHIANAHARTYGEVWAPDISEYQGRFFIYYPQDGKLFVVHADKPSGPWSEPVDLQQGGIDPCHVVAPDGTRYLYYGGADVRQLSADGLSLVGEQRKVHEGWKFPDTWKTAGFWMESPKLTRRGEYYYLINAEGGTDGPPTSHMAVVARSKSPLGPWENSPYNPLIHTYSADEDWWSVGHGTLVSTPDNRWYFVYHGYRNGFWTLGRNTLMEPVIWTNDNWPLAPLGARRGEPMPAPMGVQQRPMIALSDDFRGAKLRPTWQAWNERDMSRFAVGNGTLTMRAKGDAPGQSSPLTIMARDESYEVQVGVAAVGGCAAGLGLFYNVDNWMFAEWKDAELRVYTPKETLARRPRKSALMQLKIINRANRVEWLAREEGGDWQTLVADVDVSGYIHNNLRGFQALRPALLASGAGSAQFSDFVYRAR